MKCFSNFARWCVAGCAAVTTWVAVMPAQAQTGVGDVVYVPTPQIVVDEMLGMAKLSSSDYLIDLGSGDGRFVITAAKRHGARALGVDLDKFLLKVANDGAQKEGVADRVTFREENLFQTDFSAATVISTVRNRRRPNSTVCPDPVREASPSGRVMTGPPSKRSPTSVIQRFRGPFVGCSSVMWSVVTGRAASTRMRWPISSTTLRPTICGSAS